MSTSVACANFQGTASLFFLFVCPLLARLHARNTSGDGSGCGIAGVRWNVGSQSDEEEGASLG